MEQIDKKKSYFFINNKQPRKVNVRLLFIKIFAVLFTVLFVACIFLGNMSVNLEKRDIYFRTRIEVLIDVSTFLILPVIAVSFLVSIFLYIRFKAEKNIIKTLLLVVTVIVIILGILYEMVVGFAFLLFYESNYESETMLEDGKTIECLKHSFLTGSNEDTFVYYSRDGMFLKKWICYSETKLTVEQVNGFD